MLRRKKQSGMDIGRIVIILTGAPFRQCSQGKPKVAVKLQTDEILLGLYVHSTLELVCLSMDHLRIIFIKDVDFLQVSGNSS